MVKSGVPLNPDVITEYSKFKFKSTYDFLILRLTADNKEVEVAHAPPAGSYEEVEEFGRETLDAVGPNAPDKYKYFYQLLTEDGKSGYGIYLFEYKKRGQGNTAAIGFITWIPETTNVKQKMLYTSTKDEIKKKLEGVAGNTLQLNDHKDFDYITLLKEKIAKGELDL